MKPATSHWFVSCFLAFCVSACSAQLEHSGVVLDRSTSHIVITGG